MNRRPLPPQEYLRECFDYDPETGRLTWRFRPLHHFRDGGAQTAQHNRNAWNGAHAGKEAFTATSQNGYATGSLDGLIYRAHRIILKMVLGEDPDDTDHVDGDRRNNRLPNLRAVSRSENMRNASLRKDNTSGRIGVSFCKRRNKWVAQIKTDRSRFLGAFDSFDAAVSAREDAERECGFHENHGRKCGAPCSGQLMVAA